MISRLTLGLGVACMLSGASAMGAEHKELKAFPEAKEGMERFVIVLPHKDRSEEGSFAVELVAGQTMMTDGVNQMRMGLKIESRPLKGWGYTFYEVTGKPVTISTRIAPPPGAPRVKKFVSGTPLQIRYNSRLPVVIYAPKGTEIRYRIWEASPKMKAAEKG